MDHLFEQKLVRENQQLQLELAKLNKQLKQLQETVVGYEQMINELNLMGSIETGYKQEKGKGFFAGLRGAFQGARRAVKHNAGQITNFGDIVGLPHGLMSDPRRPGLAGIGGARIQGVMDRAREVVNRGAKTQMDALHSVTDHGRTQRKASPSRLYGMAQAALEKKPQPVFHDEPGPGFGVNPNPVTVNAGQQHMYARGENTYWAGIRGSNRASALRPKSPLNFPTR